MENPLYTINILLSGKKCLLVGGGTIAEGKARSLLASGALLTVVSPELTPELTKLAQEGRFTWKQRSYRRRDLRGFFLVIASTDSSQVNQAVYERAIKRNMLVNCVDIPDKCNFYVPAIVQRGNLQISISTNGKAPYFAMMLRKHLEKVFDPSLAQELEVFHRIRKESIEESGADIEKKNELLEQRLKPRIEKLLTSLSLCGKNNCTKERMYSSSLLRADARIS